MKQAYLLPKTVSLTPAFLCCTAVGCITHAIAKRVREFQKDLLPVSDDQA